MKSFENIFSKKSIDDRTIKRARAIGHKIFFKFYTLLATIEEQRLNVSSHLEQLETRKNKLNKHFTHCMGRTGI